MGMDQYSKVGSFEEMAEQNEASETVKTEAGEVATEATTEEVVADNVETPKSE